MTYLNFPACTNVWRQTFRDHKQITGEHEKRWAANGNPSILTKQNLSIRKQAHCLKDSSNDEFSLNAWDVSLRPLSALLTVCSEASIGRNNAQISPPTSVCQRKCTVIYHRIAPTSNIRANKFIESRRKSKLRYF